MSGSAAITKFKKDVDNRMKGGVTIVVLGASGDLAKKKTFPALYALFQNKFLPEKTQIVGYARTKMDCDEFHKRVSSHLKSDDPTNDQNIKDFLKICHYVAGQYDQEEYWQKLDKFIEDLETKQSLKKEQKNRIFYMALPPSVFVSVTSGLKKYVYSKEAITTVVIEKPFGKDLESCNALLDDIKQLFKEEEVYRIDHYLGKELAKNIMSVRFANMIFSPLWDATHIDFIQITLKESFGTEGRGGYFNEFGIIRDVMQNRKFFFLDYISLVLI
jgi:glucose-6-phosphate 1-dehydrogenase